ncbi:MAG: hypothetical protein ACRDJC_15140 [Thermomicrobiales bacterium]
MDTPFEVIDLKSGNVIGGFESEAEALASLRRSFETHGPRAIRDLSLMQITDDDQFVVAMQDELERLVRDSETGVVGSTP